MRYTTVPSSSIQAILCVLTPAVSTLSIPPKHFAEHNPDGSCVAYTVRSGDTCSTIARSNGLTVDDLAVFNDGTTWGWSGCEHLDAGVAVCLSEGSPPMPESISTAVCGPLKPGSSPPMGNQTFADLNPCPLNSCCTIWGQCGTTAAHCTKTTGPTGNPGTAPLGQNGCISNCGTKVTSNDVGPDSSIGVAHHDSCDSDDLQPAPPLPRCDASFNTIGELDAMSASIPKNCKALYTVATLSNVLDAATMNFAAMVNDGYADKFETYARAVQNSDRTGSSVRDFVNSNGNKYFSCVVSELAMSCDDCKARGGHNPCKYCFQDGSYNAESSSTIPGTASAAATPVSNRTSFTSSRTSTISHTYSESPYLEPVLVERVVSVAEPCPPDYSQRGSGPYGSYVQSVHWTLLPEEEHRFYADLYRDTGVPRSKTKLGDHNRGNTCAEGAKADDNCWAIGMDFGIPQLHEYGVDDVLNPAHIAQQALADSNNLQRQISDALVNLELDACYEIDRELLEAISVPILMIADAVENMARVETIARKIDHATTKDSIIRNAKTFLYLIHLIGEALGKRGGFQKTCRVLRIVGIVGEALLALYRIIDDPDNNFLQALVSILFPPFAVTDFANTSYADRVRQELADNDLLKLGGRMQERMETINKVIWGSREAL